MGEHKDSFLNWDIFKGMKFSSFVSHVVSVVSAIVLQMRPQAVFIMWLWLSGHKIMPFGCFQ